MTRPNILLITTDQQHWDTLSCIGSPVQTPHLDKLAAAGRLLSRAYCPNPTCTPTRASIITGQYPSQHGAWSLGTKLPEDCPTVGALLQQAGYRTSLIGKAHFQPLTSTAEWPSLESYPVLQDLDFWRQFDADFYGFDHVELARNHVDEAHVGQHYAIWMEDKGLSNWRDYFKPPTGGRTSTDRTWELPAEYHYNEWISQRSCAMIDGHVDNNEPFLLWASYFDPHPAYLVPEPWASMYDPAEVTVPEVTPGEHDANPAHFGATQDPDADWSWAQQDGPDGNHAHGCSCHLRDRDELAKDIAVYYGMISYLDHSIGQVLAHLDAKGLADDTLVVFTTDHGHYFGQHGLTAKGPYHYEDGIRVPFLCRWPGHIAAGTRSDALCSLVDLAPTFLEVCGLPIPRMMTGISQRAAWCDEVASVRDHVIVENRHQPFAVHHKTYIDERYKLTVYHHSDEGELFDLQEDPGEIANRWSDPEALALKAELLVKYAQAELRKEPLPMPRIHCA